MVSKVTADPNDPNSIIRWRQRVDDAFEQVIGRLDKIDKKMDGICEGQHETEVRLERGDAKFSEHDRRLQTCEGKINGIPEKVVGAIKPIVSHEEEHGVTFRWLLEKLALPLLMSGAGAGIALAVSRAVGG